MRHHETPEIGKWFLNQEVNNTFEVVAVDEKDGLVEIQYFSGEIEEVDLDNWYDLNLKRIAASEDWSGPYEIAKEDLGYSDETIHPEDWSGPLNEIEPDNL